MSIVSNIIRRDVSTCLAALLPSQCEALGITYVNPDTKLDASPASINKLISDACSTREAVELVASLGKTKGALSVTSLTARGEIEKVSKKDGGNSPAWVWACKVNKLAAALRRALDVE